MKLRVYLPMPVFGEVSLMPSGMLTKRGPDGIVRRGSESPVGPDIQGPKAVPAPRQPCAATAPPPDSSQS